MFTVGGENLQIRFSLIVSEVFITVQDNDSLTGQERSKSLL